jgi:hypothetical protein
VLVLVVVLVLERIFRDKEDFLGTGLPQVAQGAASDH